MTCDRKAQVAARGRRHYWRKKVGQRVSKLPLPDLLVRQALVRAGWLAACDIADNAKVDETLTKMIEGVLIAVMRRDEKPNA